MIKLSRSDKHFISEAIEQFNHWKSIVEQRVAMVIEDHELDPGEYMLDLQEGIIKRREVNTDE